MNDYQQPINRIYEFFAEICKIPHPSSYCENIRKYLKQTAEIHNLKYREDNAGNVRLDRKNAVFSETILLQSHMDMVPQSIDNNFDFTTQSIEFEQVNGLLRSKGQKTTLGADNGIGMASSLAAMIDENLKDIPLCALFTVDEETGMYGARNITPEFLECRAIFNLDSEEWGTFIIGCAGGNRLTSRIPVKKQIMPQDCTAAVRVKCRGLKGGHSGVDIHLNRGNAILILLDFVSESCMYVSSILGGTLSNAIPRDAELTGAVKDFEAFCDFAAEYSEKVKKEFDTFDDFAIVVEKTETLPEFCIDDFGHLALYLKSTHYGVIAVDEDYGCVATSNNLATIKGDTSSLELMMSQRSIFTNDKENLTRTLAEHFAKIGAENEIIPGCPAWESSNSPAFLKLLSDTFSELFNKTPEITYIHAGLECGLFQSIKPNIPIISFGPTIRFPHSPSEELDMASLKDFYIFLVNILQKLLKN